jgi:hypothetical protein
VEIEILTLADPWAGTESEALGEGDLWRTMLSKYSVAVEAFRNL